MGIFTSICGIIACFLFSSVFASIAGKALFERKWSEFGVNLTLCVCFWFGICTIIHMWCGMLNA